MVFCAVHAEGKSLEDTATPPSVVAKPAATMIRARDHSDLTPAGT